MTHEAGELVALAGRVERATGPSIELDEEIRIAVGAESVNHGSGEGLVSTGDCYGPPHYTESIDVALTILRDEWEWQVEKFNNKYSATIDDSERQYAATPSLALTAAALRALAASRGQEKKP